MNRMPVCTTCMGRLCETTQRHGFFTWAVLWQCPACNVHFHCCDRTCGPRTQQITAFSSPDQLVRHHRRKHKKRRLDPDIASFSAADQDHELVDAFSPDEPAGNAISTNAFKLFCVHLPAQRFFDDLQKCSFDVAVHSLVAGSCYLDARICTTTNTDITIDDVILFFRIARLVFQLGPNHQKLLGGVLSGFETRVLPANSASHPFFSTGLQLPTTQKAFIVKFLNQTNTNSLTSIIPRPPTIPLSGKDACVSIPSLIAHTLGFANPILDPPCNAKYERLVNSKHGQTLLREANVQLLNEGTTVNDTRTSYVPVVVFNLMWFDGWDPNGSSKGNRSPVWSGSVTLVFINLHGLVMSVDTCPLAAGPGKASHDVMFDQIRLDVRALQAPLHDNADSQRWHCSRSASQMALVYGALFCIWQDQPARRQESHLLGGNSNNHAIFGTSCYVTHLQKQITACDHCRQATIAYLIDGNFQNALSPVCLHCTNWRFPDGPNSGLCNRKASDQFPLDAVAGHAHNSGGGQIETSLLIRAWHEACAAMVTGRWTESTVQIYLKTLCVNDFTVKALINQCRDHVLWQEMGADLDSYDEATRAQHRREFAASPQMFGVPEPPAAWTLAPLALHVETVMHLAGGGGVCVCKKLLPNLCIDMQPR
jgi:hypothetical protein